MCPHNISLRGGTERSRPVPTNAFSWYFVVLLLLAGAFAPNRPVQAQALTVSHLAGSLGGAGFVDGEGRAARFNRPSSAATDPVGNLYVADSDNHTIRKITGEGVVTTLAGLAETLGSADGVGSSARFFSPYGIATDAKGNIYVADTYNHAIRKMTSDGVVTTLAGLAGSRGSDDGVGKAARFNYPSGVTTDSVGNVYVADTHNHTIRLVTQQGVVTTFAGFAGSPGSTDGLGKEARFDNPSGVATDGSGNLYVTDTSNCTIRKITQDGTVTTLAGLAQMFGYEDGIGSAARFNYPFGVAADLDGNLYVAEPDSHSIRKITQAAAVTTFAGLPGSAGERDGTGSAARFNRASGVTADAKGDVYVADSDNNTIRRITSARAVTTLAGLPAGSGSADGIAGAARFNLPSGLATDPYGNPYVADTSNHTIRKVTEGGVVTTFAGLAQVAGRTDGPGPLARFFSPEFLTIDSGGALYVADTGNHTIRKITPERVVTTLAGLAGSPGRADGIASAARFSFPSGLAAGPDGSLYIADSGNHTIRKITPAGDVSTIAGVPETPGSADGIGSAARFDTPRGVATDKEGNIYVADMRNCTIRKITQEGVVTTLAGAARAVGSADGIGNDARFFHPHGIASDTEGNVWVADSDNHAIRKITPDRRVTTVAGLAGARGGQDGVGSQARFLRPVGISRTAAGYLYIGDSGNHAIRLGVETKEDPR